MSISKLSINPDNWITLGLAVLFFGGGLLVLYFMGQISILDCSQIGNSRTDCSLSTTWLNLSRLSHRPVLGLQGADVEESCDDEGCSYRVILAAQSSDIAFTDWSTSDEEGQEAIARQINSFVNDENQQSMKIETEISFLIIVPVILMGVGVYQAGKGLLNIFR